MHPYPEALSHHALLVKLVSCHAKCHGLVVVQMQAVNTHKGQDHGILQLLLRLPWAAWYNIFGCSLN